MSAPGQPRRGVTPGLPTNSGSFKATERAESGVVLTGSIADPGTPVWREMQTLRGRTDDQVRTETAQVRWAIDWAAADHQKAHDAAVGLVPRLRMAQQDYSEAEANATGFRGRRALRRAESALRKIQGAHSRAYDEVHDAINRRSRHEQRLRLLVNEARERGLDLD